MSTMPILIAILGVLAGAHFWMHRARNAADMATEVVDMAQTAMGAARRYGFRRRAEKHPVDCIDEQSLAVGGLAAAFLELGGVATLQSKRAALAGLQSALRIDLTQAEELMIVGAWFVRECNGPTPAFARLAKRLNKIQGPEAIDPATAVLTRISEDGSDELTPAQIDALGDLKRIFISNEPGHGTSVISRTRCLPGICACHRTRAAQTRGNIQHARSGL